MQKKLLICCSVASLISSYSYAATDQDSALGLPWMTGPLLAPSGHTLAAGHTNVEPYLFVTDSFGTYTRKWARHNTPTTITVNPTAVITQGLSRHFDFQAAIPYVYNHKSGQSSAFFADISTTLGYQLLEQNKANWMPDLRLTLQETFPTGEYNDLNPAKKGTDATGAGSYQTSFGANFQKTWQFNSRYLRSRLSFIYTIPSSIKLTGVDAYGGSAATNGTLTYGNKFVTDLGFEYTLTNNWVPALDIVYEVSGNKNSFSGTPGTSTPSKPGGDQVALAPAMEYNFSQNLGIIAGVWFTVAGKNTADFVSGVFALNYYH